MTITKQANGTAQVYRVFIKATAEAIWDAITKPELTEKYGYKGRSEYDLRPGGAYRALASAAMVSMGAPEVVVDGEVTEADPPRKLAHTSRFLWDPGLVGEGFTPRHLGDRARPPGQGPKLPEEGGTRPCPSSS